MRSLKQLKTKLVCGKKIIYELIESMNEAKLEQLRDDIHCADYNGSN